MNNIVPLWKSFFFFGGIVCFGLFVFPSNREIGRLYVDAKNINKAFPYLSEQVVLDPEDDINMRRYIMVIYERALYPEFILKTYKYLQKHPDDMILRKILAEYFEYSMQYEKAVIQWEYMLKSDPTLIDVQNKIISYLRLSKKDEDLIKFYRNEVDNNKSISLSVYYALAELYFLKKDLKNAEYMYSLILEKDANQIVAQEHLGYIYTFLGMKNNVLDVYKRLATINLNNEYYLSQYSAKLIEYNEFDKAKYFLLRKCIPKFPNHLFFREQLILIYYELKEFELGIHESEKLYKISKAPELLKSIGEVYYFELQNEDKALGYLEDYVSIVKNQISAYDILFEIYFSLGKYKQAEDIAEILYTLDPEKSVLFRQLFDKYYELGNIKDSIRLLRSYHEKAQGDGYSHNLLGDLYALQGDNSSRDQEYRKALEFIKRKRLAE